jgi:predicted transcriptional regulator
VKLKARIAKLAKKSGRAPHAVLVDALERQVLRDERMAAFIEEALDADRAIDDGAAVFRAEDVHTWLERLANGENPARPKPWRA